MFVPCDKDGNVLEEPKNYTTWLVLHESKGSTIGFKEHEKYQQAKERCLFYSQHGVDELFDTSLAKVFLDEFCSIEELSNNIRNIQLTQTAIKQIGL
jgi:penicillin V acylase-like amidase (Ntn superfamily)